MKNYFRIAVLTFLILIITSVCISQFCFADDNYPSIGGGGGGEWIHGNSEEELVAAFKAYCRTRNFNISHEPNTVKAIVNWDYNNIKKHADSLNIDLDSLNAHIWYTYDSNGYIKFWIDTIGLSQINGIYSSIVNENNITDNSQKTLYSGEYFADSDSNGAFVYYVSGNGSGGYKPSKIGTFYRYVGSQLFNMDPLPSSLTFNIHNQNYSLSVQKTDTTNLQKLTFNNNSSAYIYRNEKTNWGWYYNKFGHLGIFKDTNSSGKYYIGTYWVGTEYYNVQGTSSPSYHWCTITQINSPDVTNANIQANQGEPTTEPSNKALEVQTQDTSINNYITNNNITNNTYNYSDDDDPPSSKPDPLPPTDTFPTNGDNNNPNNWTMPNIGIDWNLDFNDFPEIFPFSIPFDFIHIFQLLDAEPVAPEYHIECNIANVHIDENINFEWADEYMGWFRNIVLTGYVIFLIIATRGIFKIY